MSEVPVCQCPIAGYCPHLKRHMVGRLHELCQGSNGVSKELSEQYRRKWFLGEIVPKQARDGAGTTTLGGGCGGCGESRGRTNKRSLTQQFVSFASTMASFAQDRFRLASRSQQEYRRAKCESCPLNGGGRCNACGCFIAAKIKPRTSYCPTGWWFRESEHWKPLKTPVRRNLLFHMLPLKKDGLWKRHVDHLVRRLDLFNGKRVIAVVTRGHRDPLEMDSPEVVQEAFAGHRIDKWIMVRNSRTLREVTSFHTLMEQVESVAEDEVTFYGHSKGVTHQPNGGTTVHRWADAMYETCLDDWPRVHAALEAFPMAGSFKRYGQFRTPENHQWHYSGTFYWFRHDAVFGKDWRRIDRRFFGTESWPALMFAANETACLLHDNCGDLYNLQYWNSKVEMDLEQWRLARSLT
jgi:hypothetical protein